MALATLGDRLLRLRWSLVRRFGWLGLPGVVGLLLFVAALKVVLVDIPATIKEQMESAPAVPSASPQPEVRASVRPEARQLPGRATANTIALEVLTVLARSGLQVSDVVTAPGSNSQGPSSDVGVGTVDLQVVAAGQYAVVKRAVSDVLEAFPTIAVMSLSLDKEAASDGRYMLSADIRLRYYFSTQ